MKALFIGGTGNISTGVSELLADRGADLSVLNRGNRPEAVPTGVRSITADIRDPSSVTAALGDEEFDVVVEWLGFEPKHIETDIELFAGRTAQYVYISSATVYRRPGDHYVTVETAPLGNPHWTYAQGKIACEERLRRAHEESGFPVTIVRPSYTYGTRWIPAVIAGQDYTLVARMLAGRPVVTPGDGQSLWTMTHNSDFAKGFAGLLGHPMRSARRFTSPRTRCAPGTRSCRRSQPPPASRRGSSTSRPTSWARSTPSSAPTCSATSPTRRCSTTRRSSGSCRTSKRWCHWPKA